MRSTSFGKCAEAVHRCALCLFTARPDLTSSDTYSIEQVISQLTSSQVVTPKIFLPVNILFCVNH